MPDRDLRTTETSLRFPHGIPGFDHESCFHLVAHPRLAPLLLLQSDRTSDLCFLALPLEIIAPDYDLSVHETDCEALGVNPEGNAPGLLGLAIVTLSEDGPATANLMAPVVVNLATGVGVQVVRGDQRYSHQYPLAEAPCS